MKRIALGTAIASFAVGVTACGPRDADQDWQDQPPTQPEQQQQTEPMEPAPEQETAPAEPTQPETEEPAPFTPAD